MILECESRQQKATLKIILIEGFSHENFKAELDRYECPKLCHILPGYFIAFIVNSIEYLKPYLRLFDKMIFS